MQCIKISLIDLTEQDCTILNIAIKLVKEVQNITLELLREGDVNGDFALVNADTETGINYLKQEKQGQIKIILAKQFFAAPGSRFLERPVRIHDLVNAINITCKRFDRKAATDNNNAKNKTAVASPSTSSASPTAPPAAARRYASSAGSESTPKGSTPPPASTSATPEASNNTALLLHELITACKKNTLIKLECPPYSPFYVNGISGSVATRASLPEIHIIAREKETRPEVTTLSAAEEYERATDNSMTVYPIKTVIWHTALVGANGSILPNHSLNTAVKLKSLPRFPREYMRKHPEYLKMSALLTRKSMTVKQLQQVTRLHLNVIIDFYNLVFSLGLSTIDQSANASAQYERKRSENSSLLSRLAKKLNAAG